MTARVVRVRAGDTRGMSAVSGFEMDAWEAAVRRAAISGSEPELSALFVQGRAALGPRVTHEWARILSALDAGAVTG